MRPGGPHKVVHVLSSGAPAGTAQTQIVAALARGLDPATYQAQVWYVDEAGPLLDELSSAGVCARFLPFRGFKDLGGRRRFAEALTVERPSLIHLHIGGRSRIWACRRFSNAGIIVHLHGAYREDGAPLRLRPLVRKADATIAVSEAVAAAAQAHVTVVYPGVDVEPKRIPGRPTGALTVGTAARLEPIKRLGDLLRAAATLRSQHPTVRVEIAGTGSCERGLRRLATELGVADIVEFVGWKADLKSAFRYWDVFVAPSAHEGMPLGPLQAMGSGLAVVASDVDGLRELVADGQTGFLVPVGDVDRLASRINALLDDRVLRTEMGEAARERVGDRFSTAQMLRGISEVYGRVLNQRTTDAAK